MVTMAELKEALSGTDMKTRYQVFGHEEIPQIMQHYDADGNGVLSKAEMKEIHKALLTHKQLLLSPEAKQAIEQKKQELEAAQAIQSRFRGTQSRAQVKKMKSKRLQAEVDEALQKGAPYEQELKVRLMAMKRQDDKLMKLLKDMNRVVDAIDAKV